MPVWLLALATTLGMQSVASFLDLSLPIIAPLLTAGAGLAPERIGNIASCNALGTVLFLLFGGPLLARLGPVRMLQFGTIAAVIGLAIAASGYWPVLVVAGTLMGMGYGPTPIAGNRILAATAPPRHRTLIFSLKQAGAPLGGAFAGLILAPSAVALGWFWALVLAMAIGLAACICLEPARTRLDIEREPNRDISLRTLFDPAKVAVPFLVLKGSPQLLAITGLAISFAAVQGSLFAFSVTYLVTDRGLPLANAGFVYAAMQFCGVFARIFLGWLADRTGRPALNLTVQAFIGAGLLAAYSLLPIHPSLGLAAVTAGATGFACASWNGIFMAEVARLAPPDRVIEATSSSVLTTFLGYLCGPSIFSALVSWSGYRTAFVAIAAQLAMMAAVQTAILVRRSLRHRSPVAAQR